MLVSQGPDLEIILALQMFFFISLRTVALGSLYIPQKKNCPRSDSKTLPCGWCLLPCVPICFYPWAFLQSPVIDAGLYLVPRRATATLEHVILLKPHSLELVLFAYGILHLVNPSPDF